MHDTDEESVDSDFPPFYGKLDEPQSSSSGDECVVVENPVMVNKVSKLPHRICTWEGMAMKSCYLAVVAVFMTVAISCVRSVYIRCSYVVCVTVD